MDLIITDENGVDIEVIKGFELDLAYGSDENDFELKQKIEDINSLYKANYRIYIEGTEYGGIIDDITIDTDAEEVTYHGRTWHGILNSKIICPDSGADYKTVSGDIVAWFSSWLTDVGLDSLFEVPSQDAHSVEYQFDRYCTGYVGGILKCLIRNNLKLILKYYDGKVQTYIYPYTVYSDSEEWSADKIELTMTQNYNKVNHLICLGSGELSNRQRIDLYSDADGNISQTQTITGLDEVTEVYDYSNVESEEKLLSDGIEELKSRRSSDTIETALTDVDVEYDIGDKIEETESLSGLSVAEKIVKKIVTMSDSDKSVSYEVGGTSVSSSTKATDTLSVEVPTKVSELENDAGYITPAGFQMTGNLTWKGENALPQFSGSPSFLLGIESFSNGGTTKWQSASSCSVGYATKAGSADSATSATSSNSSSYSTYTSGIGDRSSSDKNSVNGTGWYSVGAALSTPSGYSHNPLALNWYWGVDARTCDNDHFRLNGNRVLTTSDTGNFTLSGSTIYSSGGTTFRSEGSGYNCYVCGNDILLEANTRVLIVNYSNSAYQEVYASKYTIPSSKLVKENIETISEEEAKKILELNPVNFDYIEAFGGQKNNIGLIAEEVEELFPKCVTVPEGYDEDTTKEQLEARANGEEVEGIPDIKGVNYPSFVPYLIKMIQIQQAEIDEIKAELKELKGEE